MKEKKLIFKFQKDDRKILFFSFLCFFLAAFCHVFSLLFSKHPMEKVLFWGMIFFLGLGFLILSLLLHKHNPVRHVFRFIRKLGGSFLSVITGFFEHFQLPAKNSFQLSVKIEGYTDSSQSIRRRKKKHPRLKKKAWNSMNDSEKIRYLYTKTTIQWIKKGFDFHESDTPNQSFHRAKNYNKNPKRNAKLLNSYDLVRYSKQPLNCNPDSLKN